MRERVKKAETNRIVPTSSAITVENRKYRVGSSAPLGKRAVAAKKSPKLVSQQKVSPAHRKKVL